MLVSGGEKRPCQDYFRFDIYLAKKRISGRLK
jgi:hypothetical protein